MIIHPAATAAVTEAGLKSCPSLNQLLISRSTPQGWLRLFASIQRASTCKVRELTTHLIELTGVRDVVVAVRQILEHTLRPANPIIRHGMRHEGAGDKVVRFFPLTLEFLKEIHESRRIVARRVLVLHTQQIGLALSITTELQVGQWQCKSRNLANRQPDRTTKEDQRQGSILRNLS